MCDFVKLNSQLVQLVDFRRMVIYPSRRLEYVQVVLPLYRNYNTEIATQFAQKSLNTSENRPKTASARRSFRPTSFQNRVKNTIKQFFSFYMGYVLIHVFVKPCFFGIFCAINNERSTVFVNYLSDQVPYQIRPLLVRLQTLVWFQIVGLYAF